jgi:hypothetical protein
MDALTNVVAVLILVLILLQADVGNTVDRMLASLTPASPEQVEAARAKLAELTADRDASLSLLAAKPPAPAQLDDLKSQLALLESSVKASDVRLLSVEKLRQLQTKYQQTLDAEKKATTALLEEIRRLGALLANTPPPPPPKPEVVRIPNSREIPAGADIYYAHVLGGRVHLLDPLGAKKLVLAEFDKARTKLLRQTIKVKNAKDRKIYDQDKTVNHFAALNLMVRGQKVTVPYNRPWTRLNAGLTIDPNNGGVSLAEMANPRSEWHRICNLVRSFPRGVLIFRVRPDGFATYLKAREIADSFNLPCGWEINGATTHYVVLDGLEFNRLEEPKPQPAQPAPTGPPPPKRVLD